MWYRVFQDSACVLTSVYVSEITDISREPFESHYVIQKELGRYAISADLLASNFAASFSIFKGGFNCLEFRVSTVLKRLSKL